MRRGGFDPVLHYLDDFILFGPSGEPQCKNLELTLQICSELGVPVAEGEAVGPTTVLTYLWMELDTTQLELRLLKDKLLRAQGIIARWRHRRGCTKQKLLFLIGLLQHTCRVEWSGRSFLRRMINLSTMAREPHYHIWLNTGFHSDLQ